MVSIRAKELQRNLTDVERKLWSRLRNSQLDNFKFRRQHPIGPYIVDFFCEQVRLIVELDGGQHSEAANADARRTAYLNTFGYRVIRFWNNEVFENIDIVLDSILAELRKGPSPDHSR
ncbi:MAG: endonuclease domain-containing protein [Rhodospirillales bacterium]